MEHDDLVPLIEALLFAADQPLTAAALAKTVDDETVDAAAVKEALRVLEAGYDETPHGVKLARYGNGHQLVTRDRYAPFVENLLTTRRKTRLSRAALETAAVIAYKQPISRVEIERVRGVDAGGVLATLLERGLVMIKGRDSGPGRPLLYGTTQAFLEYFGLSRLGDLPRLDELAAMAGVERGDWNEDEQARFEKFGVDLASVPTPDALRHADPEEEPLEETLDGESAFERVTGEDELEFDEAGVDGEGERPGA